MGDPTEAALLVAAKTAGADTTGYERVAEIPFDAANRYMEVTVCRGNNRLRFMKGAPDVVLASCTTFLTPNGVQPLTPEDRRRFLEACDEMTSRALRLLGFSYAKRVKNISAGLRSLRPAECGKTPKSMNTRYHATWTKNTASNRHQAGIFRKVRLRVSFAMSDKELKKSRRMFSRFHRITRIVRALKL